MKWGVRKQRPSIGRDKRKLMKKYRNEYKAKKLSGKRTTIGKGPHQLNLSKTNYASYKANKDLQKKYGSKAIREHNAKITRNTLKAGAALAGVALATMGGVTAASALKSKNIKVGKAIVDGLVKANYKVGYTAGRTVSTARTAAEVLKRRR